MNIDKWWQIIEIMADYVACGLAYEDLDDTQIRQVLITQGFEISDIDHALMWLEMASVSGHIADVFSMLQPSTPTVRITNPIEQIYISEKIWTQLESMRSRGLISDDVAERLLEGVRSMDTRDWEDEDISTFLQEVLTSTLPSTPSRLLKRLCKKGSVVPEFYS